MTNINKVRIDIPFAEAIKKLQENDDTVLGLAEADAVDYIDIADLMSGTGNKSRFERNVELGHTTSNYTQWSGVSNEAGYTIWRHELTNFKDHDDNKLYQDDIPLTYRGLATSESTTAFDKIYVKSGTTYTDNTVEAGTTQGTAFGLMSASTDDLYVGDDDIFTGIDFNFDTLGYNYNLDVYYFNGAWTELSANSNDLIDDTTDFSSNGRITWDAPSDWISGTFNSQDKKWIKVSTTSNPVTTAQAYHVMPVDSVMNLLSLSADDIFDKNWAWCHFNDNAYVTLKNAGGVGYEGREWITRDSTDTNQQNYFVYNHELKTTYTRDDWNAPTGLGEHSPNSGTFSGLNVTGAAMVHDTLSVGTSSPGSNILYAKGSLGGDYIATIQNTHATDGYGLYVTAGDDADVNSLQISNQAEDATLFQVKGNGDVVVPTGDIYTVAHADYFSTSTIVGWAASPTGNIYYKKLGNMVFVSFLITGTSNATNVTFTVPYTSSSTVRNDACGITQDNGTTTTTGGHIYLSADASIVNVFKDMADAAWTNTGTKLVIGQFWYEAA